VSDSSELLGLLQRDLAKAEIRIEIMQQEITALRGDVRTLLAFISEAKGGWRMLMISAAVAGAIGAGFAKILSMFVK
jgi:hypothetical protein